MAWQSSAFFKTNYTVSGVNSDSNPWVFHQGFYLRAWDPDLKKIVWEMERKREHIFGGTTLVGVDDWIITTVHKNEDPEDIWMQGICRKDGKLVWERKINGWNLGRNYGGLLVFDKNVWLTEKFKDELRFVCADCKNGSMCFDMPGIEAKNFPGHLKCLVWPMDGLIYVI